MKIKMKWTRLKDKEPPQGAFCEYKIEHPNFSDRGTGVWGKVTEPPACALVFFPDEAMHKPGCFSNDLGGFISDPEYTYWRVLEDEQS